MNEPYDSTAASRRIYAFRRNLVVTASAGTGKTHALVGVAIHLLVGACRAESGLRPPIAPGELVATTFSRRAAAEIRERIDVELGRIASGDRRSVYDEDLAAAFREAGEEVTEAELRERARRARSALGRAQIGTLHGFAASILRDHALLVGLSPDFDVPDEETTRQTESEAIERVLERRARNEDTAGLLQLAGGVAPLIELVGHLLARVADDGTSAASLSTAEEDEAEIDASMRRMIDGARDVLDDPRLSACARETLRAWDGGDTNDLEVRMGELWSVVKSTKGSPEATAFFELRDAVARTTSGQKLGDRGRSFVRRWRYRNEVAPRARSLLALLRDCEAEIAEATARRSEVGFSAILRAARDILRDDPDVAAEAGARYGALLVDEFQDTSGVQRDLVQLLWERDETRRTRSPGTVPGPGDLRGEGLLVVGDRKQSIYGFRGADVGVFAELSVGLAGAAARAALDIPPGLVWEPAEPTADFVPLRVNRRSKGELLELVNTWCRLGLVPAGPTAELYEVSYAPDTEDLVPPEPTTSAAPGATWIRPTLAKDRLATSLYQEASAMACTIAGLVRDPVAPREGAPLAWRDVAILARRHEMLSAAAYALAVAGVPHVMAGTGFYGAREVRDLVAMLALVVDPDDSLARAEVLRGVWAGVTDKTMVALTDLHAGIADPGRWAIGERRMLIEPSDRAAVAAVAATVLALRPVAGHIGPGAVLREAARALHLEEALILMPRGEQRVANARKLLAIADDASDGRELVVRLRRAADLEQREGEAAAFSDEDDAVRLLTIHASKGLAFPVVFLPEAGAIAPHRPLDPALVARRRDRPPALVIRLVDEGGYVHDTPSYSRAKAEVARREAAERRRLTYVALTRAEERMFFVGDRAPPKGNREAYDGALASALSRIASDDDLRSRAYLDVVSGDRADSTLRPWTSAKGGAAPSLPPRLPSPSLPRRAVAITASSLREATPCARRAQLGAAASPLSRRPTPEALRKRLAEGEPGAFVTLQREETLALRVDGATAGPPLVVSETVDVVAVSGDGQVTLLHGAEPGSPDGDVLHASILRHAARSRFGSTPSIRVGFCEAKEAAPVRWVEARDLAWTEATVRDTAKAVLTMRRGALLPRVPLAVCEATGCPHALRCHPVEERGAVQTAPPQTAFDFFGAGDPGASARRRRAPRR